MRKTVIILVFALMWVAISATAAFGEIELEEGATFDGGICWEADGTEGISTFDGQCLTPADYDAIYSYENLSSIPAVEDCWPGTPCDVDTEGVRSIAEVYDIQPDDDPASDRPIGTGLVEPGEERTFKQRVARAHAPHLPVAA